MIAVFTQIDLGHLLANVSGVVSHLLSLNLSAAL